MRGRRRFVAGAVVVATLPFTPATARAANPVDYHALVIRYADAMVAKGRDRYGPTKTKMFGSMLDRHTYQPMQSPPDLSGDGIRPGDRAYAGANPMHDQQLYELLYDLSVDTGDSKYRGAAQDSLDWFFRNTRSPNTNLLPWGEHLSWNLLTDQPNKYQNTRRYHEFFEPWELWSKVGRTQLAPFADGLWQNQINDQTTGTFSRHADYDTHYTTAGEEFPRHGGYYIRTWATAYASSTAPSFRNEMLHAIDVLLSSYERRRLPSGGLPAGTSAKLPNAYWPENVLQQSSEFVRAAALLPPALAARLRQFAGVSDDTILKLPHEVAPGGRGFVVHAHADTLATGDTRPNPVDPWSPDWAEGYAVITTAQVGREMLARAAQGGNAALRTLGLAAADRYLQSDAPSAPAAPLQPAPFADVLELLIAANASTGNAAYLQRADALATEAVQLFLGDGLALPKVDSVHDEYETITGGDNLMLALYHLDRALHS